MAMRQVRHPPLPFWTKLTSCPLTDFRIVGRLDGVPVVHDSVAYAQ